MNYTETIEYLYSRLPMFSRTGASAYKADLSNTIKLCKHLDNPQQQFKSVHIAGTNGKGSVSHMLAAIFQSAGFNTGLYTSPHLKDFRERIKINGEMVTEEFVISFTENVKEIINEIEPSFFEVTVAMAFSWFAQNRVGIAIIETGLGGRLDSTNVIIPELSVITNIGYDHMNILGDSLEQIAAEKAGIIKEKVPVVIGESLSETLPVFKKTAAEKNAPLSIAYNKRQVMDWAWKNNELVVEVAEEHQTDHEKYQLDLTGVYQKKNLLTVLEAVSQLQQMGWNIEPAHIHKGLMHARKLTGLHGRWEVIQHHPLVVLDVAHNEDGIRQLIQQTEVILHRQLHIVMGMVKDKEVDKVLMLLPKNAVYYFTRSSIPRALPEDILMQKAAEQRLKGRSFPDVNAALSAALEHAHKDDLVLVCGSVFVVGEVNRIPVH
jgi:dihydrofolate synthase/folylpolyglutamate synthase